MSKFTIGENVEKLDRLDALKDMIGRRETLDDDDLEDIFDLLSDYADLLLGIKVEI